MTKGITVRLKPSGGVLRGTLVLSGAMITVVRLGLVRLSGGNIRAGRVTLMMGIVRLGVAMGIVALSEGGISAGGIVAFCSGDGASDAFTGAVIGGDVCDTGAVTLLA